jgi:hypothetical protein
MTDDLANPRYLRALEFAVKHHGVVAQARKGSDFPYVVHVIRVAEILSRFKRSENVVVAGFLHDTVEDAGVSYDELSAAFNRRVSELVMKASEPDRGASWRERKQATIDHLRVEPDPEALALVAADKLDNVLSIEETLRSEGRGATWSRFNASEDDQRWYYRELVSVLLDRLPEDRLVRTLDVAANNVFPDKRRSTSFFAGAPLGNPHDARAYLADPIKHWRPEYSAFELAHAWLGGDRAPRKIDALIDDAYGTYRVIEGFFEKETRLDHRPRPSQTDLLLLVDTASGLAVVGIEAKATEGFEKRVSEGRRNAGRIELLCQRLNLTPSDVQDLRYQLLHRTVAVLLEAERYGAERALMIVESFDANDTSFDDYRLFGERLGLTNLRVDALTSPTVLGRVELRLGWAKER